MRSRQEPPSELFTCRQLIDSAYFPLFCLFSNTTAKGHLDLLIWIRSTAPKARNQPQLPTEPQVALWLDGNQRRLASASFMWTLVAPSFHFMQLWPLRSSTMLELSVLSHLFCEGLQLNDHVTAPYIGTCHVPGWVVFHIRSLFLMFSSSSLLACTPTGSESYPYKGMLDTLSNRAFADGTNAWVRLAAASIW